MAQLFSYRMGALSFSVALGLCTAYSVFAEEPKDIPGSTLLSELPVGTEIRFNHLVSGGMAAVDLAYKNGSEVRMSQLWDSKHPGRGPKTHCDVSGPEDLFHEGRVELKPLVISNIGDGSEGRKIKEVSPGKCKIENGRGIFCPKYTTRITSLEPGAPVLTCFRGEDRIKQDRPLTVADLKRAFGPGAITVHGPLPDAIIGQALVATGAASQKLLESSKPAPESKVSESSDASPVGDAIIDPISVSPGDGVQSGK